MVLVSTMPGPREPKLAWAARACGYRLTLVSEHALTTGSHYYDGCHRVKGPWETLALLDELAPDVIHCVTRYDHFHHLPVLRFARDRGLPRVLVVVPKGDTYSADTCRTAGLAELDEIPRPDGPHVRFAIDL